MKVMLSNELRNGYDVKLIKDQVRGEFWRYTRFSEVAADEYFKVTLYFPDSQPVTRRTSFFDVGDFGCEMVGYSNSKKPISYTIEKGGN